MSKKKKKAKPPAEPEKPEPPAEPKEDPLCVSICEAKPNKMFSEEQRQGVRFLTYNRRVKCAECGKQRKEMWTALYQFYAMNMSQFVMQKSKQSYPPLTPVCGDHPLAIAWGEPARFDGDEIDDEDAEADEEEAEADKEE